MPHPRVVVHQIAVNVAGPDPGRVLGIRGGGVAVEHPDKVAARVCIDLRHFDPHVGIAAWIPAFNLVGEQRAVRVVEAQVLTVCLHHAVVDTCGVKLDENRKVGKVFGTRRVVESELAAI